MSTTVRINGKTYTSSSSNISIINGKVTIDGVAQDGEPLSGVVKLELTGDLASLKTDASVTMSGNVQGDVDAGGSVACGNVGKDVDAGGSVNCDNIGGNVDAGGSVNCGKVSGDVDAGGSVIQM